MFIHLTYVRRAILALGFLVALSGLGAMRAEAQLDVIPKIRLKVGIFLPQNSSVTNVAGNTWLKVGADVRVPLSLGLPLSQTQVGVEYAVHGSSIVVPVTLSQIFQPSAGVRSPVYFGAGVGLWTAHISGFSTASRVGFRLITGIDISQRLFLEGEYDFVDSFGSTRVDGLSILVGTKF